MKNSIKVQSCCFTLHLLCGSKYGLSRGPLVRKCACANSFIELLFGMSGLKLWIDRPKMLVLSDYNIAMRSREEGFCDAWYSKKRAFDVGAGGNGSK